MNGGPWLFDAHLLSLKPFDGLTPPLKMDFSREIFWVQCRIIPIGCMNARIGTHIGNTLGVFKDCDVEKDGPGWARVLCLCIEMDLHKPLSRWRAINIHGNSSWMPITYEKLPKLRFRCGKIAHGMGACNDVHGASDGSSGQFRLWLRVEVDCRNEKCRKHLEPLLSSSTKYTAYFGVKQNPLVSPLAEAEQCSGELDGKPKSNATNLGDFQKDFMEQAEVEPNEEGGL